MNKDIYLELDIFENQIDKRNYNSQKISEIKTIINQNYLFVCLNINELFLSEQKYVEDLKFLKNCFSNKNLIEIYYKQATQDIRSKQIKKLNFLLNIEDKKYEKLIIDYSNSTNKNEILNLFFNSKTEYYLLYSINVDEIETPLYLTKNFSILQEKDFISKIPQSRFASGVKLSIEDLRSMLHLNSKYYFCITKELEDYKDIFYELRDLNELFVDYISFMFKNPSIVNYLITTNYSNYFYFSKNNISSQCGDNTGELTHLKELRIEKNYTEFFLDNSNIFNLENQDYLLKKVRNGLKYYRKATNSIFMEEKVLNHIISIESILTDENERNAEEKVKSRFKYFARYLPDFENNLKNKISYYYYFRNDIAHRGANKIKITVEDYNDLKNLNNHILDSLVYFSQQNKFKNINEIINFQKEFFQKEYEEYSIYLESNKIIFQKSYLFKGVLFLNDDEIGHIEAEILFKNNLDKKFIEISLKNIIITKKSIRTYLGVKFISGAIESLDLKILKTRIHFNLIEFIFEKIKDNLNIRFIESLKFEKTEK